MFLIFVAFFVSQAIASGFEQILPHPDSTYDSNQILGEDTLITSRVCKTAPPITVTCAGGHITLSETNFGKTDSTTIVFRGDTTEHCRKALYDVFQNLAVVAALRIRKHSSPLLDRESVEAQCFAGTVRLDAHSEYFDEDAEDFDTDHFTVRKLTLESDTSHACRIQFTAFLLRSQAKLKINAVESADPTTLESVKDWLSTSLICSNEPPLEATCIKGVVQFPYENVQLNPALKLTIKTDGSHLCTPILDAVNHHVTRQEYSLMVREKKDGFGNAIVSVCQQGYLVTTDRDVELSAISDFQFYSAPNLLCARAFNKVLEVVIKHSKQS